MSNATNTEATTEADLAELWQLTDIKVSDGTDAKCVDDVKVVFRLSDVHAPNLAQLATNMTTELLRWVCGPDTSSGLELRIDEVVVSPTNLRYAAKHDRQFVIKNNEEFGRNWRITADIVPPTLKTRKKSGLGSVAQSESLRRLMSQD